jgi:hypothetical protein
VQVITFLAFLSLSLSLSLSHHHESLLEPFICIQLCVAVADLVWLSLEPR